jgi:hypothetical protein
MYEYISILKCGPGLLFIGLRWPSVQVEFDMPGLEHACATHDPCILFIYLFFFGSRYRNGDF